MNRDSDDEHENEFEHEYENQQLTYKPLMDAYYIPARRGDVLRMEQHHMRAAGGSSSSFGRTRDNCPATTTTTTKLACGTATTSSPTSVLQQVMMSPATRKALPPDLPLRRERRRQRSDKPRSESNLSRAASRGDRSVSHHSFDACTSKKINDAPTFATDHLKRRTRKKNESNRDLVPMRRGHRSPTTPSSSSRPPSAIGLSGSSGSSSSTNHRRHRRPRSASRPRLRPRNAAKEPPAHRNSRCHSRSRSVPRRTTTTAGLVDDLKDWLEFINLDNTDSETKLGLLSDTTLSSAYCFDHVLLPSSAPPDDIEAVIWEQRNRATWAAAASATTPATTTTSILATHEDVYSSSHTSPKKQL